MVFSFISTYFGDDIVSVAVDFFAFFFLAFLVDVLVSVLVFCANIMAEPDNRERLRAATRNFFI
jgi:hypothetical protein